MRKLLLTILAVIALMFAFTACDGGSTDNDAYFLVDGGTYMGKDAFLDWVQDDDRNSEGVHQVKMLKDWKVDEDGEDDIYMHAKMELDMQGHKFEGEHDDHLFDIDSGNCTYLKIKNGRIHDFADYTQDGGVFGIDKSNVTLILEDMNIYNCHADRGGVIYIDGSNNNVQMSNTTLHNNCTDDYGGAVYIGGGKGNVINGNNSTEVFSNSTEEDGGAFYLNWDGCTVKNMTIESNGADEDGGGIYSNEEDTLLSNLVLIRNVADEDGGGIYVYNDETTLENVTVTNNDSKYNNGDGVCVARDVDVGFYLKGCTKIYDNQGNGANNNLYIADPDPDDTHVNTFGLTSGSNVHIGYKTPKNGVQVSSESGEFNTDYITCDNPNYYFKVGYGRYLRMYVYGWTFPVAVDGIDLSMDEFEEWCDDCSGSGSHTISMNSDWITDDDIEFESGCNIELYMNGHMIKRTDDWDSVIFFGDDGNSGSYLKIYGGDKSISHSCNLFNKNDNRNTYASTIKGGLITGGSGDNDGGAIYMNGDKSHLTLTDVTLAGNSADSDGGAIWVDDEKSSVTLVNSTIKGNWADGDGGAIFVDDDLVNITLNNSSISDNYADDDGGAIYTSKVGAETLFIKGKNDSSITYNKCAGDGGAIFLGNDSISTVGLTLKGNEAADNGGAAYSAEESIKFSNCTITGNTADKGGGLYIYNDNSTISACTITGNDARNSGDGVFVASDVDMGFMITGKTVIKNNPDTNGNYSNSNVYISDNDGDDSRIDISGLMSGADVHVGYKDPGNRKVSYSPGTYDTQYITCDNDGYYFEWNRSDRYLYMKSGSAPAAKTKTEVAPGKAEKSGTYGEYDLLRGYLEHGDSLDATLDTDVTFYYSDGYFDDSRDPKTYNEHLATTSINMAMTSIYSSYGGTTEYKGKHEPVRQFLADIGCDDQDIYVNDFYTQKPTTKSIGVAIASKELKKSNGDDTGYTLVPIAIRSAAYELEWVNNAMLGSSGEAAGFSSAATTAMEELEKYILKYDLEDELKAGKIKFWIAGYSRGGATANLLAKRVIDKYGSNNKVYAYTLATPIGGQEGKNSEKYYGIHNCLNYADLIPLVAPSRMGFVRYGVDHYIPGTSAGTVKNYKDSESNKCVADNEPLITKTDAYNTQRNKMLKQLEMVDSTKLFDDYFRPAYISLNIIKLLSGYSPIVEGGSSNVTAEQFERDLINDLQDDADGFKSRKAYADTVFTLNNKSYNTTEGAVGDVLGLVFGGDDTSDFVDDASTIVDYIPLVSTSGLSLQDIFDDLLGDWHTLDEKTKDARITGFWDKLKETGAIDKLTDEQKTALEKNFPVLVNVALQFEDGDYYNKDERYSTGSTDHAVMAGTAANNLGRLIPNHYSEIYLAWARTFDDFYSNETKEYKVKKPDKIEAPAAKVAKKTSDSGDETENQYRTMETGKVNILKGDTKVILDIPDTSGEAIYYTLKTEDSTSSEQIYKGGVDLTLQDNGGTEYEITAKAMQYDKTSESVTYKFKVEDSKHKVSVGSTNLYYNEGETATAVAPAPEKDKFFVKWNVSMKNLEGDTTTLDLTGDSAEAVKIAKKMFGDSYSKDIFKGESISFIMPAVDGNDLAYDRFNDYEIVFEPVYEDKISKMTVTHVAAGDTDALPTAGEDLPDKIVFEEKTTASGKRTITADNLQWSYDYNGKDINASGKAYNTATYTAKIVLSQDEANRIMYAEGISKDDIDFAEGIEGAEVTSMSRSSSDGSLTITVKFPVTADSGGEPRPDTVKTLKLNTIDLNNGESAIKVPDYKVVEGTTATITAPAVENEVFAGWDKSKSTVAIKDEDLDKQTISFVPTEAAEQTLMATYIPVVQKMEVTLGESDQATAPVSAKRLPEVISTTVTISNKYGLDPDDIELTWTPESVSDGIADYSTAYTAKAKLSPKSNKGIHVISINGKETDQYVKGIFIYADNIETKVNGEASGLDKDETALTYTFPATEIKKRNIVMVNLPAGMAGLEYGTDVSSLLPETTTIFVEDNGGMTLIEQTVGISWDKPKCVSGGGVQPSSWKVSGKLILPENVKNERHVSTDISINYDVNGAPFADKPVADTGSGTYHKSFKVELSTKDGSEIYYTLDGSTPTEESTRYSGPIEINRDGRPTSAVTLNAYAVKDGCRDSSVSVYVYEFDNHVEIPGGNDTTYDGDPKSGVFGSDFYTLESDSEAVVIDENTGDAKATEPGKYTVTAKINSGYEWITGTDKDGKDITDTEDKKITFKVQGSLNEYMDDIEEYLRELESSINKMDDKWKYSELLSEGIVGEYQNAYDIISSDYEKLKNDVEDGVIARGVLIETAAEISNNAKSANDIAEKVLNQADYIDNVCSTINKQGALLETISDSITSYGSEELDIKLTGISAALDQVRADNKSVINLVPCLGDEIDRLQSKTEALKLSGYELSGISVDLENSVRFYKNAESNANFVKGKTTATFIKGTEKKNVIVTEDTTFKGQNLTVADNATQEITARYSGPAGNHGTKEDTYKIFVGSYYAVETNGESGDVKTSEFSFSRKNNTPTLEADFEAGDSFTIRGVKGVESSWKISGLAEGSDDSANVSMSDGTVTISKSGRYIMKIVSDDNSALKLKANLDTTRIAGELSIEGVSESEAPAYGDKLTAKVENGTEEESGRFQWYRGDIKIKSATNKEYTLCKDDIGQVIQVSYSEKEKKGKLSATLKKTVGKRLVSVESGIIAKDKKYDGDDGASLNTNHAVFNGKLESDKLAVTATGTFEDKNAGKDKNVAISDMALTGTGNSSCYKLAEAGNQISTTATINKASPKLRAIVEPSKKASGPACYVQIKHEAGDDAEVTLTSSDESVARINDEGEVTVNKAGTVTFTASVSETQNYLAESVDVTLDITQKSNGLIKVESTEYTITRSSKPLQLNVSAKIPEDIGVVFSSSNTSVAKVDENGLVRPVGIGTANIKITIPETANYNAVSTLVKIKVIPDAWQISSISKGNKQLTVKWKKASKANRKYITGYQVRYSTDSNFKLNVKYKTVVKNTAKSVKVTKLKKKRTYYVQLRTYKKSGKTRYYSNWSSVKAKRTR